MCYEQATALFRSRGAHAADGHGHGPRPHADHIPAHAHAPEHPGPGADHRDLRSAELWVRGADPGHGRGSRPAHIRGHVTGASRPAHLAAREHRRRSRGHRPRAGRTDGLPAATGRTRAAGRRAHDLLVGLGHRSGRRRRRCSPGAVRWGEHHRRGLGSRRAGRRHAARGRERVPPATVRGRRYRVPRRRGRRRVGAQVASHEPRRERRADRDGRRRARVRHRGQPAAGPRAVRLGATVPAGRTCCRAVGHRDGDL